MDRKIFAGQNKYFGETVKEVTEFWLDLGINHIMIKQTKDMLLVMGDETVEKDFQKLTTLQEEYGVVYHLHLYDLKSSGKRKTSENNQAGFDKILIRLDHLLLLDSMIFKYGLYPLITIHPAKFGDPSWDYDVDEEIVWKKNLEFFKELNLDSKLALETMHDPDRNPGYKLLGYKAEHFENILNKNNSLDLGLCIDTGHSKMAEEPLSNIIKLPCPIYSVHLNGNDGSADQHHLPTFDNVGDFQAVIKALRRCQGPIVLEIGNHNYSKEEIKECIQFWKNIVN